ncbi:MAG TPA: SRPBCC family protein [Candidatus Limnocylindrales bacterium]|jgi:hypothetical protein
MRLREESIVIGRPIHEVFAFVADATNDPRWHTTVVEAQRTSAGPIGLGTTFEGIYDSKKRTLDALAHPANFQRVRAVITEFVANRSLRIQVEFTDPPRGIGARVLGRSFDLTFRFEAVPEGTRVYRAGEFHPVPLIRPLVPLFARLNSGRNRYLLANLKRAVESRTVAMNQGGTA